MQPRGLMPIGKRWFLSLVAYAVSGNIYTLSSTQYNVRINVRRAMVFIMVLSVVAAGVVGQSHYKIFVSLGHLCLVALRGLIAWRGGDANAALFYSMAHLTPLPPPLRSIIVSYLVAPGFVLSTPALQDIMNLSAIRLTFADGTMEPLPPVREIAEFLNVTAPVLIRH